VEFGHGWLGGYNYWGWAWVLGFGNLGQGSDLDLTDMEGRSMYYTIRYIGIVAAEIYQIRSGSH